MNGGFSVRAALEVDDELAEPHEYSAVPFDDLDFRRHGSSIRHVRTIVFGDSVRITARTDANPLDSPATLRIGCARLA